MRTVTLVVNGTSVAKAVEPRTHLADFLREQCLLTATHIGCEHGVCGACTVLLDDAPARSCIAFVAACEGSTVRTIEGLQSDTVMQALRAAFTAEHALQCGYCTPGMLVTARDIVLRLPDADATRIRLELAGNLCRCTGYAGIVRAIQRVLAQRADLVAVAPTVAPVSHVARWDAPDRAPSQAPLPKRSVAAVPAVIAVPAVTAIPAGLALSTVTTLPVGPELTLDVTVHRPPAELWSTLQDPALLATCVPGARLVRVENGVLEGEMQVALGAITATFAGTAQLALDDAARRAVLSGEGHDNRTGTLLTGFATFVLQPVGDAATRISVAMTYVLRGPLAPLARGPVARAVAAGIAETVARNLEHRLDGTMDTPVPARLSAGRLLLQIVRQQLRRWLHRT